MNTGGDRPAEAASDAFVRPPGTFAPILEACRSLAPPELLDSGGWARLLGRVNRLPRSVADTSFGFEFHLAEPATDADLCVVVLPADRGIPPHRLLSDVPVQALGSRLGRNTERKLQARTCGSRGKAAPGYIAGGKV